jgi:hypothetical protein
VLAKAIYFGLSDMSAFGPKQTSAIAVHMSAFGGKADMVRRLPTLAPGFFVGGDLLTVAALQLAADMARPDTP